MWGSMDRTTSIEREPRTLSFHQLQTARELAICVLNTNSVEEASKIFTEGLEPVVSIRRTRMGTSCGDEFDDIESFKHNIAELASTFRDIATAPF